MNSPIQSSQQQQSHTPMKGIPFTFLTALLLAPLVGLHTTAASLPAGPAPNARWLGFPV
jgi:hypothetical protein